MAVTAESISRHKKEYGVTYMIGFLSSTIPVIAAIWHLSGEFDDLSTDMERQSAINRHSQEGEHPKTVEAISRVALVGECRWLDSNITRLDDLIYELTRDGADPDRVRDKEVELQKFKDKFTARNCSNVNY